MTETAVTLNEVVSSLEPPSRLCANSKAGSYKISIYMTGKNPGDYVTIAYTDSGIVASIAMDSHAEGFSYRGEYMSPREFVNRARRLTL